MIYKVYINSDNTIHYIGNEKIITDIAHIVEMDLDEIPDYENLILKNDELVEYKYTNLSILNYENLLYYEKTISEFFRLYCIDRTLENQGDLTYQETDKDFETIIRERIDEITNTDKNIHLLLSGGLNSTLVFYALVEKDIIFTVHFNEFSEAEYPLLINQIQNGDFGNVNFINHTITPTDFNTIDNKIVLTGELGDQIFGSNKVLDDYYNIRNQPYKLVFPETLWRPLKLTTDKILKHKDTSTAAQWLWCVNFIFKWNHVDNPILRLFQIENRELVHFFNSEDFQKWSMTNQQNNAIYSRYSYKKPIRDYIFSQNGDDVYRDTKTKILNLRK